MLPQLPSGFLFGTGTAAYQVEGAVAEDGRGPSVWDTFTSRPGGGTIDGSSGGVAADHYHRYLEDLDLVRRLGTGGYRFSLSWSRIQPYGVGRPNPRGLDFYDRLVDAVLDAGAAPMATLYHWDLPQALEDEGGWLNRDTIDRFAEYAALVGERLADRVAHWIPVHQPNAVMAYGYGNGQHAPGLRLGLDGLVAAHHLLVGHGRATIALREAGARSVGCANNHAPVWPASADDADVGAAKLFDALWNGLFAEPMLLGSYPVDLREVVEDLVEPGDMATIRQPLDFYGIDYGFPVRIGAAAEDADLPFDFREVLGHPLTDRGRPVAPQALREWLITLRARYRAGLPPLVITGSGCACGAEPDAQGRVDDEARVDYLRGHLEAVATAIDCGVDVRGYYATPLLDGFEWDDGFTQRCGLVHVDFQTQVRTPKRSFEWYAEVIAGQGAAEASSRHSLG